jgi:hypothetical protein
MLTIKTAANGYILQMHNREPNLPFVVEKSADTPLAHVDAAAQMLNSVLDLIGPSGSRHAEKRIRIITMPGEKFSGQLSLAYQAKLTSLRDELNDILGDNHGSQG